MVSKIERFQKAARRANLARPSTWSSVGQDLAVGAEWLEDCSLRVYQTTVTTEPDKREEVAVYLSLEEVKSLYVYLKDCFEGN